MANGNPFGIVPVNVAGVFGAVQQFKQNALNLQIGQQGLELNELKIGAAKADIARQKEAREAREAAIGAKPNAIDQAFIIDPKEGKAIQDFVINKSEEERRTVALAGRKIAGILAGVLSDRGIPEGAPIPQEIIDEALALGIKPEDIPLTKDSEQIKRSIFQTKQFATLLENSLRGAKMFVRFTDKGEQESTSAIPGSPEAIELESEGFVEAGKPRVDLPGSGISPTGLTKSQAGKRELEFESATETTVNLIKEINRVEEQIREGGATRLGFTGGLAKLADNIAEQFDATAELLKFEERSDTVLGLTNDETQTFFKDAANESAALASNVKSLAFLVAIVRFGQQGRALSDNDRKIAFEIVAAAAQSPSQMLAVMDEVKRAAISQLETKAQIQKRDFDRDEFAKEFGLKLGGPTAGPDLPIVATQAEFDALPSGTRYRETPNGPIFEKP